jgi:cytochrome c-type biogenesis protein
MHKTVLGAELLFVYAMGLAVPFFISSLSLSLFLTAFKKIKPFIKTISVISGVILIAVGILIFFNYLSVISLYFGNYFHYKIPYNS